MTGLNRRAFRIFLSLIDEDPPVVGSKRGRLKLLTDCGKLGLYLIYCSSAMKLKFFALYLVKLAEFAEIINQREPSIINIIGFVDAVSVPVMCSCDHHDTMCDNVFAFLWT